MREVTRRTKPSKILCEPELTTITDLPMSTLEKRINTISNAMSAMNGIYHGDMKDAMEKKYKEFTELLFDYLDEYQYLCICEQNNCPFSVSSIEIERLDK